MDLWVIAAIAAAVAWAFCGWLAWGVTVGYFEGKYPERAGAFIHWVLGVEFFLLGPIGLLMAYLLSGRARYGLKW